MESTSWSGRRVEGATGVAFAVLLIVGFVLGEQPALDDPAADWRAFFIDNDTQVHLTTWFVGLGFVFFFLPFAAGVRNLLAPVDTADEQMWVRLSYTGAVLTTAIALIGISFWEVLSQGIAEKLSDDALVALARFDTVIFGALMPWAVALFLATASAVILRSGVFAKWIGWLGAAGALLLVIGTLWVFGEDNESVLALLLFIGGLLSWMLWVLVVGITMIRSDQQVTPSSGMPRIDEQV